MDSFIHVAAFSPTPDPSPRSLSHFKSLNSVSQAAALSPAVGTAATERPRIPTKSTSTSNLANFARPRSVDFDDEMSTIRDPRRSPGAETDLPSPNHHPDLNDEVATLSTKLINAINHQTILDDTLSSTRHDLESARSRIRELEAKNAAQREIMSGEVWVRRSTLDGEKRALQLEKKQVAAQIAEEKDKRLAAEKEKTKIEQELENLTAALFEEANQMVVRAKEDARADYETLQRKNDQLKAQLADNEGLLKSQQEQLSELKGVMETMASERDDATNHTAPSSPGFSRFEGRDEERNIADVLADSPSVGGLSPAHPTSFHHILQPVLRHDLAAYEDFIALARLSRKRPESRVSSSSLGGLNSLGAALASSNNSAPQSPNLSYSTGSPSATPIPSLKETRFFKRVLAEDVEPTLRLDVAPGLSWLARRTVISAVAEGSLVVEPVPTSSNLVAVARPQFYPCSLCGDSRRDNNYLRYHRFRTSEAETAQRHPLCKYCLHRVRSTCEFLGFLRMVKDGHWRADDEDHERTAWEETVRLREQMFWARIGGGVLPLSSVGLDGDKSRRPSHDQQVKGAPEDEGEPPVPPEKDAPEQDLPALPEEADQGSKTPPPETKEDDSQEEPFTPPSKIGSNIEDTPESAQTTGTSLDSDSETAKDDTKPKEGNTRLSLSIPFGIINNSA